MTRASDLYRKIRVELEVAARERDTLRGRLYACTEGVSEAERQLAAICMMLLPKMADALPRRFGRYAEALRFAAADADYSSKDASAAADEAERLADLHKEARDSLEADHAAAEKAMLASQRYVSALEELAAAKRAHDENAVAADEAGKRMARLTELARQNWLHGLLMKGEADSAYPGHFLVALWRNVGRSLRATQWYRRLDKDRADAGRSLDVALENHESSAARVAAAQAVIGEMVAEMESGFRGRRDYLALIGSQSAAADKANAEAARQAEAASKGLREIEGFRSRPAKEALADALSLFRHSGSPSDAADIATIEAIPGCREHVTAARDVAARQRKLASEALALREQYESAEAAVDQLDQVVRKMSRSGMSKSSKTVSNVEDFMSSGIRTDFDLTTLTMISAVAESVYDSSPSSSWDSSSSFGGSSGFD